MKDISAKGGTQWDSWLHSQNARSFHCCRGALTWKGVWALATKVLHPNVSRSRGAARLICCSISMVASTSAASVHKKEVVEGGLHCLLMATGQAPIQLRCQCMGRPKLQHAKRAASARPCHLAVTSPTFLALPRHSHHAIQLQPLKAPLLRQQGSHSSLQMLACA